MSAFNPELASVVPLPDHLAADPYALIGGAVAAGIYAYTLWKSVNPEKIEGLAKSSSNPALVRTTVEDLKTNENRLSEVTHDRWYRIGSSMAVGLGAIAAGTAFLAGPSYATTAAAPEANTAVAVEASNSFMNTIDMQSKPHNESRFNAAINGVINSNFKGNLGIILFGENTTTALPVAPFNPASVASSVKASIPKVNTSGNDLAGGIQAAYDSLPNHKGKIVAITDGIGAEQDDSQVISKEVAAFASKGVKTQILVEGTSGSNYIVNFGAPQPATPDLTALAQVPSGDILTGATTSKVSANVQSAVGKPVTSKENHFWYPSLLPAAALIVYGLVRDIRQRRSKLI